MNRKPEITIVQPSGEPATIKWITVGGRTSAFVVELQRLNPKATASADVAVSRLC